MQGAKLPDLSYLSLIWGPLTPNCPNSSSSSSRNIPVGEEYSHQSQLFKTSTFKEILEVEVIFYQKNISELLITLERNDIPKINNS